MNAVSRALRLAILGSFVFPAVSGCGGGGAANSLLPAAGPGASVTANSVDSSTPQLSDVAFSIAVPNAQTLRAQSDASRSLKYISASTKSAAIDVSSNGQAMQSTKVDCSTTCAATLRVPAGVNTFSVALYDAANGSGHVLANGQATTMIAQGKANNVSVIFNGVPVKLAIAVTPAVWVAGTAATSAIAVSAYDAGGNIIVGAQDYAAPIVVKHSDSSGAVTLSNTNLLSPVSVASLKYSGAQGVQSDTVTATTGALKAEATVAVRIPATPAPTPVPAGNTQIQSSVRKHVLTYQEHLGSTQTTPFGKNYGAIAPYIDYASSDANATPAMRAAGVKVGFYATTHTVCITQEYGQCTPDASEVPDVLIAKTCDGHRVTFSPPVTASNPYQLVQFQTDPSNPAMVTLFNKVIDDKVNNSGYGAVQYDFVFDDNAYVLGDSLNWQRWYDYSTGAVTSPSPYCGYNTAKWIDGMRSMFNGSKLPVIANSLGIPDSAPAASSAVQYFNGTPNLWGGMFEYIYGSSINGPSRTKESDRIWQSEENTQLAVSNAHRLFLGYEHVGGTDSAGIDTRLYVYASMMLSYDPNSLVISQDGTSSSSHVGVNPEAQLVPMQPLVAQPQTIAALQTSGGAYVREFAACYYQGTLIGPCASVVNSSSSSTAPLPALQQHYAHTAVISGAGIVPNVDNGKVRFDGSAPPASIAAKTALILVQ